MATEKRLGVAERVAVIGIIAGVAGAIAAVALEHAYPDAPLLLWRVILWSSLAVLALSLALLLVDLLIVPQVVAARRRKGRMIPLVGMAVSVLCFVGFAGWYFWPARETPPSQQALPPSLQPSPQQQGGVTIKDSNWTNTYPGGAVVKMENSGDLDVSGSNLSTVGGPVLDLKNSGSAKISGSNLTSNPAGATPTKPELRLSMSGANIFRPDAPGMTSLTGIGIDAKVWNTGAPSVAIEWSLVIQPEGKKPVTAQLTRVPEQLVASGPSATTVLRAEDALDTKTSTQQIGPVPVAGILLFYTSLDRAAVLNVGTKLQLSVKDTYDATTVITQSMGDWLRR